MGCWKIGITYYVPESIFSGKPTVNNIIHVFNFFDKLEMRRGIKQYIIHWRSDREPTKRDELLDKLFFQDYEKHPLLERIIFVVTNPGTLGAVMEYLIDRKKELFVNKQVTLKLKHLQAIEVQIDSTYEGLASVGLRGDWVEIQEFGTDQHTIKISNVDQCIESIECNMLTWLNEIISLEKSMTARKVVLVV